MTAATIQPLARPSLSALQGLRPADAAVGATLAWWATAFTWGSGGQDPHLLTVSLVLLAVATAAVRPWERLPAWLVGLVASVGVAAFTVALVSPSGWKGAIEAASYVFASQLGLVLVAWLDEQRRTGLAALLLAATLFEFAKGFVQWWASGSADHIFVGTFYWHNQTGVFLVMGVALGLMLVDQPSPVVAGLGWLAVPLCSAGVVYTTSRAAQIAMLLAYGVAGLAAVGFHGRRLISLGRLAVLAALSVVVTQFLAGPPVFSERVTASLGQGDRHEPLTGTTAYRLDFWRQGWDVFTHWPLTGAGFHSFAEASKRVDPGKQVSSAYAHNGFVQLLSDGGLVLTVPVVAVLAVAWLAGARRAVAGARSGDSVQAAAFLALTLLLLHSGMDFDWGYPSLLSAAALLAALSAPSLSRRSISPRRSLLIAGATVGLIGIAAVVAWGGTIQLSIPIGGGS